MTFEGQSGRWTTVVETPDGAATGVPWVEVELTTTCRWTGKAMHALSDGMRIPGRADWEGCRGRLPPHRCLLVTRGAQDCQVGWSPKRKSDKNH